MELDAFQGACDCLLLRRKSIAVGPCRTCEFEREAGRAVGEVVHGLGIGSRRIWMIQSLHDRPSRAGLASNDGHGLRLSRAERLDLQAVISLGGECAAGRGAFEHFRDQPLPLLARGSWEFCGKRKVVSGTRSRR